MHCKRRNLPLEWDGDVAERKDGGNDHHDHDDDGSARRCKETSPNKSCGGMRPAKTVGPVDGGVAEEAATIPGIGEAIVPIASEIDFQILSWTPILLNINRKRNAAYV